MFKIFTAKVKYIKTVAQSVIVVISGEAISAGSNLMDFANSGKQQPRDFAKQTTKIMVIPSKIAYLVISLNEYDDQYIRYILTFQSTW